MPTPEIGDELTQRIEKLDQYNEAALGDEPVRGVDGTEALKIKLQKIKDDVGKLPATQRKEWERKIQELVQKQDEQLDSLQQTNDGALRSVKRDSEEKLDALAELLADPKAPARREDVIKSIAAQYPEYKRLVDFIPGGTQGYEKNTEGYFIYLIFSELIRDEEQQQLSEYTPDNTQRASSRKSALYSFLGIVGRIGEIKTACRYIINHRKLYPQYNMSIILTRIGNQLEPRLWPQGLPRVDYSDELASLTIDFTEILDKNGIVCDRQQLTRDVYEEARGNNKVLDEVTNSPFLPVVRKPEDLIKVTRIHRENGRIERGGDMRMFIELGYLTLDQLTPTMIKRLRVFHEADNYKQLDTSEHTLLSGYRSFLTKYGLETMIRCGEKLNGALEFASFLYFCLLNEHFLPTLEIEKVADRFKKSRMHIAGSSFPNYAASFAYAKNLDDAFRMGMKLSKFVDNRLDLKYLPDVAGEFPPFSDASLKNITPYYDLVARFKEICTPLFPGDTEAERQEKKQKSDARFKSFIDVIGAVWLRDISAISNTPENRQRIASVTPLLLDMYDTKLRERGSSTHAPEMKLGNTNEPSQSSKIGDRSIGYMADRAIAKFDNINGIQLNTLHKRENTKGGINYVHYYENHGEEYIREIRFNAAQAEFGVYFSQDRGAGADAKDTPMQTMEGVLVETSGCMVHDDGVPTEVLAVAGDIKQSNIHPTHDGLLLIGADGIPHIEHIEHIDGALVGKEGNVNAKYGDRETFAQRVQDMRLTAMQAPLLMKNGKPLTISNPGVPWYKRAFVKFSNGDYGFMESKQPVDQRSFEKVLIDAGVQDALALDTGFYDRYVDANGEQNIVRNFNPVIVYARKRD